jgi:hypothetical protein
MKTLAKRNKDADNWVCITLTLTYRQRSNNTVIDFHTQTLDLPILEQHRQEMQELAKSLRLSDEQALARMISAHLTEKAAAYNIAHPDCTLEIMLRDLLTYRKSLT